MISLFMGRAGLLENWLPAWQTVTAWCGVAGLEDTP